MARSTLGKFLKGPTNYSFTEMICKECTNYGSAWYCLRTKFCGLTTLSVIISPWQMILWGRLWRCWLKHGSLEIKFHICIYSAKAEEQNGHYFSYSHQEENVDTGFYFLTFFSVTMRYLISLSVRRSHVTTEQTPSTNEALNTSCLYH